MSESSAQDKTEDATPKRLEDAKKKGQIPRSKELSTLASLLGGACGMAFLGPGIIDGLQEMLTATLQFQFSVHDPAERVILSTLKETIMNMFWMLMPLFVLVSLVNIVSPVALGGWVFSTDLLAPKFERIDPLKGLGRIVSPKGLIELVKAIAKFILVGAVVFLVIKSVLGQLNSLPLGGFEYALSGTGKLFIWCFLLFSSVLLLVVVIDIPYQVWDFKRQVKMSKQEVRDEMKEQEGKPEVKSAIRERQQEMSRNRMIAAVPSADVIVTNPTHYAVALKYEQSSSRAPIVVAKGKDIIAAKIREVAKENEVPIFSAPPLARALFASTELEQEIPEKLFIAVAQVLAYIFQLQEAIKNFRPAPPAPIDLPVPPELDIRS